MKKIRVFVVDDSPLARELIIAILSRDKDIEVTGEAANGLQAVEKIKQDKPDIVTMDIEMPVMDGLEAIEKIMAYSAVPILVVTTRGDAKTAYAAISKGALDLVVKPDINIEAAHEFIDKVKLLSKIKVVTHISGKRQAMESAPSTSQVIPLYSGKTSEGIIAVASSTGGPDALSVLLSGMPENFPCPIVIAQHMSDGFVSGMAEWLKTLSKLTIKVASHADVLSPSVVYISPSEKHMIVNKQGRISLIDRHPKDIYRPSCDVLLSSVAQSYGAKSIGVILTGMGSDGSLGMKDIKSAGGYTIAQDEKTSVVFGMPKVAIEDGSVDKVLPIGDIGKEIINRINKTLKTAQA